MSAEESTKVRIEPRPDGASSTDSPLASVDRDSSAGHPPSPADLQVPTSGLIAAASDIPADIATQRTIISKDLPLAGPVSLSSLPPAELGRLLLGERLGHYELLEFVGGGGMGAVFRAQDSMLNRIVAVKVLSRVQSDDEETLRRFKNEAQSTARLDHDNIGRVHYVGEDRGWHYIVFEFIEGVNLRELVSRDGPLPLADVVSYTLQMADALAHASERDVVHRDIKPSNVLITPAGRAKLVDMGLARLHQVEHPDHDLTASGVTLGTFDYISPEQARDPRHADVRSDLYSLGCTVYYMLTGQPPFPEGTVLQKLLQHQADEAPDPRQLRPDLPEEMSRIVRTLLAKTPQQRYQRPAELTADLLALADQYGLQVPQPTAGPRTPVEPVKLSWTSRHLPWLMPLGVLGVVVVALAMIPSSRDDDAGPPPIRHRKPAEGSAEPTLEPRASRNDSAKSVHPAQTSSPILGNLPPSNSQANSSLTAPPKTEPNQVAGAAKDEIAKRPVSSDESPATNSHAADPPVITPPLPVPTEPPAMDDMLSSIRRRLQFLLTGGPPTAATSKAAASKSTVPSSATTSDSASATMSGERKGLLVVRPRHHESGEYGTLAEACRAAQSGDVIELRFDGRLDERPLDLIGLRLTIRAGEGFLPTIGFQPRPGDPPRESHGMIALADSQLTWVNVRLELDVPRDVVAESWSLVEIRPGESLRLEGCTVTIRNATDSATSYHPDVAVFDVRAMPGGRTVMPSQEAPVYHPPASVQLKNCIVRGESLFVRANQSQPLQVTWDNGLLATTERFLSAIGGPSEPKTLGQIQIELRHVTALMRTGFCSLSNTHDAPLQLPLEVNASDCILIGDASAPLIEQSGIDETADFRKRITWNGDRNFYEGFSTFWRISSSGADAQQMSLAEWQTFWGSRENQPVAGKVAWQELPPATRPVHELAPADFGLRSGENPARGAASDGRDAGFQADQLPIAPQNPAANAVDTPASK